MLLRGMQYISEAKFNEGIMIWATGLRTHEYDQQGTGIAHAVASHQEHPLF